MRSHFFFAAGLHQPLAEAKTFCSVGMNCSDALEKLRTCCENTDMTTTTKADEKSRITLRGAESGQEYIVTEEPGGWFVRADRRHRRQGLSAADFNRLWQKREVLDADTATEIADNIRQTREASRARPA